MADKVEAKWGAGCATRRVNLNLNSIGEVGLGEAGWKSGLAAVGWGGSAAWKCVGKSGLAAVACWAELGWDGLGWVGLS